MLDNAGTDLVQKIIPSAADWWVVMLVTTLDIYHYFDSLEEMLSTLFMLQKNTPALDWVAWKQTLAKKSFVCELSGVQ